MAREPSPGHPREVDPLARRLLQHSPVVAVLGAHHEPHRAAYYVPAYLAEHGYEVWPVNPTLAGRQLFGRTVVATLAQVPVAVDLVDVFRRAEHLPDHHPEILAMSPRPGGVWLQLGVVHPGVEATLRAEGLHVVSDRCMLADHRMWGLGAPSRAD